jgi:hypothetical protein
MKKLTLILALSALLLTLPENHATSAAATCTGARACNACKTCNYCGHCAKQGGTCGVCKPKK